MQLYRLVFAFLFITLAAADPCLAEDYAEANCARSSARTAEPC